MNFKGYIYCHISPEGKKYIGQSINPKKRWGGGYTKNSEFERDIKKFGWDCFNHKILAEVELSDKTELRKHLLILEEEMIVKYNTLYPNGYNLETQGKLKLTCDDVKQRISQKLIGNTNGRFRKNTKHSEDTINKIKRARANQEFTKETRRKQASSLRKRWKDPEFRQMMINARNKKKGDCI